MTETEAKWSERVREWRAGGKSAEEFAEGRGFKGSTLRYWASSLRKLEGGTRAESRAGVRLLRVVRKPSAPDSPIDRSAERRSAMARVATRPRSAFVTTSTSGTSMIPAFKNCKTSPEAGCTTTAGGSTVTATGNTLTIYAGQPPGGGAQAAQDVLDAERLALSQAGAIVTCAPEREAIERAVLE